MSSSDKNAKITAMTIVPANGSPGNVMPSAMASTAPSAAPDETPSVEPSASGFLSSPCILAPASDSAAPLSATHKTRGRRTVSRMEDGSPSGCGVCVSALRKTASVSASAMLTLPTQTHRHITAAKTAMNSRYCQREKCSGRVFIHPPNCQKGELPFPLGSLNYSP